MRDFGWFLQERESKIQEKGRFIGADQNISRLQIAMKEAGRMRSIQDQTNFFEETRDLARSGIEQSGVNRFSLDQLRDKERRRLSETLVDNWGHTGELELGNAGAFSDKAFSAEWFFTNRGVEDLYR